jgi:hypothetical protein
MTTDLDLVLTEDLLAELRRRCDTGVIVLSGRHNQKQTEVFVQVWGDPVLGCGLCEVAKATVLGPLNPGGQDGD